MTEHGVAIVGLAGKFPNASSVDEFWENTVNGIDCTRELEISEIVDSGVEPSLAKSENYVRRAALLDDIDKFDAKFFDYLPFEAELLDPQIRMFLELVQTALDNAGCDPERYDGSIGVYAGAGINNYLLKNVLRHPGAFEDLLNFRAVIANDKDFLSTQVNYKFDLKGPGVTIQSACSTSLVAIQLAYQSLLTYQCDVAISGGSHLISPKAKGAVHREGDIYAPDGVCRPFDSKAAGTIFGEGAGVVVLKRIEDAIKDKDHIYAVIRGAALNNDGGGKVSYAAPSISGQAEAVALAQQLSDINPEQIEYVEAHGTGTHLGDPIEVRALTEAFRLGTDKKNYCALSSVKSMIGHLDVAAGVTGLIRTALGLHHKLIPPTTNFKEANPELNIEESPFYVCAKATKWVKADDSPRVAAVSSFGVGGTNAHAVLQEAPDITTSTSGKNFHLITLSAKTDTALETQTEELATYLEEAKDIDLADVAFTLQAGRRQFSHRKAVVCESVEAAIENLRSPSLASSVSGVVNRANVAVSFMFSGQGSQHLNMCRDLYQTEPVFAECLDQCAEAVKDIVECNLLDEIFSDGQESESRLKQTAFAQPALYAVECGLAKLWQSYGVNPENLIGHSIGEFVAAHIAGVFSLEDGARIVATRGQLMQKMPTGKMLNLRNSAEDVEFVIGDRELSVVVLNGPELTVVGGSNDAVETFKTELEVEGIQCDVLHTSHAFHSPMMDKAVKPFVEEVSKYQLNAPKIPYVSNVTGGWISPAQATDPNYWGQHLRMPVQFSQGIETLVSAGNSVLLEVGPGQVLSGLCKQQAEAVKQRTIVSSSRHPKQEGSDLASFLKAYGSIWSNGGRVDLGVVYQSEQRRKAPLPTYPFERQSYWIESSVEESVAVKNSDTQGNQDSSGTVESNSDSISEVVSPVEWTVAVIKKELGMALQEPDYGKTFFELGLDSLAMTRLGVSIEKEIGIRLSSQELSNEYTSVELVANYLEEEANLIQKIASSKASTAKAQAAPSQTPDQTKIEPETEVSAGLLDLISKIDQRLANLEWAIESSDGKITRVDQPVSTSQSSPSIEVDLAELPKSSSKQGAVLMQDEQGAPAWHVPDPDSPGGYKKAST